MASRVESEILVTPPATSFEQSKILLVVDWDRTTNFQLRVKCSNFTFVIIANI